MCNIMLVSMCDVTIQCGRALGNARHGESTPITTQSRDVFLMVRTLTVHSSRLSDAPHSVTSRSHRAARCISDPFAL